MKQTSQYHGVCWHKGQQQWRVKVKKWGKEFYKEFVSEVEAAKVYDCAALIVHGPDAQLNFDGQPPPGISRRQIIAWLAEAGLIQRPG